MYLRRSSNRDYSEHLYLTKHAPQKLMEFKGNLGVVQTISSFIESKNIPNMIITGPHGTGKSLIVQLMVKEYLGDDYYKIGCLEIYGSLSRGKDVVSEKQSVKNKQKNFNCTNITDFMKRMTKMPKDLLKIVIIYEFHQMSAEAQMALRRIMELNSHKVRFVFVTQNYGQIIQALQSRCTILKLQKLDTDEITEILETIANKEDINISDKLLELINLSAEGDIRCAVNLLQLLGRTSPDKLYSILGVPEIRVVMQLIDDCIHGNARASYQCIKNLLNSGFDISDLLDILTRTLIKYPYFPEKNMFLRSLCQDTFTIQECYTETQFYNLINHLVQITQEEN